jgi:hypothetical protein
MILSCVLCANVQLIERSQWSIENKQLDCAAHLRPIVQAFAAILTDTIDRPDESLARREKMK